jgi:hypothetical protein
VSYTKPWVGNIRKILCIIRISEGNAKYGRIMGVKVTSTQKERNKNSGHNDGQKTKFCVVAPNVCGSLKRKFFMISSGVF